MTKQPGSTPHREPRRKPVEPPTGKVNVRTAKAGPKPATTRLRAGQGRAPLIEHGWDPVKGTWKPGSVAAEVIAAVHELNHLYVSALAAGITRTTLANWLRRGRAASPDLEVDRSDVPESERPYVDFLRAITKADAQGERDAVRRIRSHADRDWRAEMAILSRRHADRWGERSTLVVEPADESRADPVRRLLDLDPTSAEALEAIALAYERTRDQAAADES